MLSFANPSTHQLFQVYTIAEEPFRGQEKQINAQGMKILYIPVDEGTMHANSKEAEDTIMKTITTGVDEALPRIGRLMMA